MILIRSLISSLIVAVIVLSGFGLAWWAEPPEKLAGYATGGQVILAILIVTGFVGLWRLWTPAKTAQ